MDCRSFTSAVRCHGDSTRYKWQVHDRHPVSESWCMATDDDTVTLIADELKLKVVTIATNETDGYERFMRSAELFGIDVQVRWLPGWVS